MTYPTALPRHLAQLVRVLLHDSADVHAQKAALRAAVLASHDGPVMLTLDDRRLLSNGTMLPLEMDGADDLATQMIGHGVCQLMISGNAAPGDLLTVARTLAEAPIPGRTGQAISAALAKLEAPTVRATLDPSAVPHEPPRAEATQAGTVIRPGAASSGQPGRAPRLSGTYLAFATVQPRNDAIEATLAELRETTAVDQVTHLLEELAVLVDDAAEAGANEVVADALAEIVARERAESNTERKRAYTMALRRFGRPAVLRVVVKALPKCREKLDAYAAVLARMGEPGAEVIVSELTESESLNERRVYFDMLLKLRMALPKIIGLLGDSRWYVARNAADLLAEMPTPEAELPLAKLLKHDDDRVRRAAAVALGKVGTASACNALRTALGDDSAQVRLAAAAGLGSWKSRTSTQVLAVAFEDEGDGDVQLQIISTLGRVATEDAIERLTELAMPPAFLRKKPTSHRVAAVQALGETRSPAAIKVLQQLDDDKDPAVRAAVVQAMNALRAAARRVS